MFVPRSKNTREDDGYILTMRYCENTGMSRLEILDAQHINDGPVATIKLPCRVPYGFHGNWVPKRGDE